MHQVRCDLARGRFPFAQNPGGGLVEPLSFGGR
jgi:hypothetical protein